jgi:hypothetical protein
MKQNNDEAIKLLLADEWQLLQKSILSLNQSFLKCKSIGKKSEYSFEEQESFDSLSSKFNRTSDIFTQKVLRTTWMLLHESFVPFIDMMNVAEKIGIIHHANEMIIIRDLRNQITHEYIPEALIELIPEILELCPVLIANIQYCEQFLLKRAWI